MEINEERDGGQWTISLVGRLDTLAAAELDQTVQGGIAGVTELVFDFADVPYIAFGRAARPARRAETDEQNRAV